MSVYKGVGFQLAKKGGKGGHFRLAILEEKNRRVNKAWVKKKGTAIVRSREPKKKREKKKERKVFLWGNP